MELRAFQDSFRTYFSLMKPRVVTLVVFTGIVGMLLAGLQESDNFTFSRLIMGSLCIALGAGASGSINMWYDRDIDCIMQRTKHRPIPMGKVSPNAALTFGILMSFFSVAMMGTFINGVSALLLSVAIFSYSVVYTMILKRHTVQNIVIGGASGAFPPIIGWAAISGKVEVQSILLFLLIFFWTPPHFWALALKKSEEYKKANIPMLPVVSGHAHTKVQIAIYSCIMVSISMIQVILGFSGKLYFVFASGLGIVFLYYSFALFYKEELCMSLFYFSMIYLFLIFGFMVLDGLSIRFF